MAGTVGILAPAAPTASTMPARASVLIITYNHATYIEQAVRSALEQRTDFDYEIVVGDDHSTDGAQEVLSRLRDQHADKIRLILRDERVGAYRNFVDTYAQCRGDYIALLDGDDFWTDPEKLRKQIHFLEHNPSYSIVGHRVEFLYQDAASKKKWFDMLGPSSPRQKTSGSLADAILIPAYLPTRSMVFRRKGLEKFPDWYADVPLGDWSIMALLADYGRIHFMNEIMATQRIHGQGIHSSNSAIVNTEGLVHTLRHFRKHFGWRGRRPILKKMALGYQSMARFRMAEGRWLLGVWLLLRSWGMQIAAPQVPRLGISWLIRRARFRRAAAAAKAEVPSGGRRAS